MKRKQKRLLICALIVIIIIAAIVATLLIRCNTERVLKCKSLSNDMEVIFKGNKPVFVQGKIDVSGVENLESVKESISIYSEIIHFNETKKNIKYSFSYNEINSSALNFIGLSYDKKMTYKEIKKNLQNSNYYCK